MSHDHSLNRRTFLTASSVVASAGLGVAPAIVRGQSPAVRWRCTSAFPKSLDLIYGGAETLSRLVSQMTGGKFQISVYPAGEIATMPQIVDSVQSGAVECGHTYPSYYFGKDEVFALDGAVPFGLNARQMLAWTTEGNGAKLLRDFYRGYGIVNFPLGNTGAQMGGWYRRELRTVTDLNGLKMRIGGFAGRVALRLGVVPQNVKDADVYSALEKSQIDAADWVSPYDDLKAGFYRVAPIYYHPAWWEGGAQFALYVNQKAFDALPAEYKIILEAACARAHAEMLARYDARNPQALRTLLSSGARLYRFPVEIVNAAFKVSNETYAELSATNPNWRRVYEDWSRFRSDAHAWTRVSDSAFDQIMQSVRL